MRPERWLAMNGLRSLRIHSRSTARALRRLRSLRGLGASSLLAADDGLGGYLPFMGFVILVHTCAAGARRGSALRVPICGASGGLALLSCAVEDFGTSCGGEHTLVSVGNLQSSRQWSGRHARL